jgi:SAM-dependent methyltransferase
MREFAVAYLVCPDTGAPLRLEVHHKVDDHVMEGELINTDDKTRRYPITGGVPRFVQTAQLPPQQLETIETFAYKWSRIPNYAHEQATKGNREQWYFQRFGFTHGDQDVRDFLRPARFVLEAGTGTGVDTDLLARNFAGILFGVDISSAIDLAYERLHKCERVVLVQADIGRLPFRPGFFDVVSCDQVLHHTPDPPAYFKRLVRVLRPGGRLLLYVYRIKGPLREFADDYLRGLLTQAPLETCLDFAERITRFGHALSRLQATVEIADDIPELGIKRGSYDVQRLIYDHVLKCFWNDEYDFMTNAMINFDWYRPLHAFRYSEADVRSWGKAEGLEIQHLDVSASGISTIMQKPHLQDRANTVV